MVLVLGSQSWSDAHPGQVLPEHFKYGTTLLQRLTYLSQTIILGVNYFNTCMLF